MLSDFERTVGSLQEVLQKQQGTEGRSSVAVDSVLTGGGWLRGQAEAGVSGVQTAPFHWEGWDQIAL